MPVLPCMLDVPRLDDMEAQFLAFWTTMRRNIYGYNRKSMLDISMQRKAKNLAADAHKRRLREAGLSSVKTELRPALTALAREGARLSGPATANDVHVLAAALHAESGWMRDVSTWIMQQMLRHVAGGGRGFALPPVILAGPPGIGKSHYARKLADLAGTPVRMIDVGGGSAGFRISGTEKGWGTEQPGVPVETILARKVANPLMIVDEIDKAGIARSTRGSSTSIVTSLLQMLETGTARHFECPFHRIAFDMSRVVWIMTANDVDRIPAPLRDRSRLFILPKLSAVDAIRHFDRLTADCEDEAGRDRCRVFIEKMSHRSEGISLRQIGMLADTLNVPAAPLYQ
ncbi:AAA family ATPase [Marivita sp. GX14005]|uniref:AAA family ATPase n=1 Tax=Marivita sp. GX14005 TaxID=2942276 RepID=UPI00201962C4|nr:AAA family ATPase [Marivita sp. GX14005]MCL3883570.1 AAA family ATPase [Marivita sp. GX14005]